MTREEFLRLLKKASASALDFARELTANDMTKELRYRVLLNQSYDGHATSEERVYPKDDRHEYRTLTAEGVADVLWREGRCPEWIDVAVEAESDHYTLIRLLCCGRYSNDDHRLYYQRQGTGPFGIKSPDFPSGYVEGTKFNIPKV